MKVAFIGAGEVGAPLAVPLTDAGHEVVLFEPSTKRTERCSLGQLAASPVEQTPEP